MMKISSNKKKYFILVFSAIFLPYSVFASNVYIDTNHQDFFVGDTVMFSIRIDSENKNINAVEGSVVLDYLAESASLVVINTAGSGFSLWPDKPLPSENNTSISFVGGTSLGLNSKDAIIFNFVLKMQEVGQITLVPNNFSVYLNDGKGTKDKVRVENFVIDVLPERPNSQSVDDLSSLISNDRTPPEPFEIYLGQEKSVFDGKEFLSFSTTDKQSGVAYYEVIEGDLPPVRSDSTYILREKDKSVIVKVIAYDLAGNMRESVYTYSPTSDDVSYLIIIVFVILILILVYVIYKKRNKKRKSFPKNTSM